MKVDIAPVPVDGEVCAICAPKIRRRSDLAHDVLGDLRTSPLLPTPDDEDEGLQTTGLVVEWSDAESDPVCARYVSSFAEDIPLALQIQVEVLGELAEKRRDLADLIEAHVERLEMELLFGFEITEDAQAWAELQGAEE